MKHLLTLAFITGIVLPAQGAVAQSLRDDPHITGQLVAAQVGDILRGTCPQVSARMLVVFGELVALENYVRGKGHDEATVRAFLDSAEEKARIRALADDYLAKAGAKVGDVASYCAVARAEVAAGTVAGSLIRVAN
jgi:hypothetical protein